MNRGHSRFEHDVFHTGRVIFADGAVAINLDFDVQVVVFQQYRGRIGSITQETHALRRIFQADFRAINGHHHRTVFNRVALRIHMRALRQREVRVQKFATVGNHFVTTNRVVTHARLCAIFGGNHVRAVQGIVQAAPARIGRVQRIARVPYRNHELRTGDGGDLCIDVFGGDLKIRAIRHDVANFDQKGFIGGEIRALVRFVPRINFRLQFIAFGQQSFVLRGQIEHHLLEIFPIGIAVQANARQSGFDEVKEDFVNGKTATVDAYGHDGS